MKSLLFLATSLALLTGCLPTATHPLGSAEKAAPDERFDGVWFGKSGNDQIFLHFVQSGKGAEIQIVEVDHEKKGEAHTTLYRAFPTAIAGNHYLNIREGKNEGYYFARYQFSKAGLLSLSLMGDDSAAKAISAGKIKGKVSGPENNREVQITDSTEHLAAFVAKADPDLLFNQKFGSFKKVALPSVEATEEKRSTPSKPAQHSTPTKKKKKAS